MKRVVPTSALLSDFDDECSLVNWFFVRYKFYLYKYKVFDRIARNDKSIRDCCTET